jgi:hypothetical protein
MNADGIIIASNTEGIEESIENCRIPVDSARFFCLA